MDTAVPPEAGRPVRLDPDLDFIRALRRQGGDSLKKCFQCGTCSATCARSPDVRPFPRKEMAWAVWGLKERLLADPDVWLCYRCNDCSTRCPRGARPGDVLGAVREEAVVHYAFPRFLGRWAGQPWSILLLLAFPALILTLALRVKEPLREALGIASGSGLGEGIVYSYSHMFPHWLLNSLFGLVTLVVVVLLAAGAARFWKALGASARARGEGEPVRSVTSSIVAALRSVLTHDRFAECEDARNRYWWHLCVLYGFLGLTVVTLWIITSGINPLIDGPFVYPFGFWSPWKLLANAGGAAVLFGCLMMAWDRIIEGEIETGSYFDWTLIVSILLVVITGFITEALHYVRLEPHRHIAYFTHLALVLAFLMYLPYSKIAHAVYRTVALVHAEHTGRENASPSGAGNGSPDPVTQEEEDAGE